MATLVRQYEGETLVGGMGSGQQAWNALYVKYHNNSNEAQRACYEKLVNFRMEQGQDPDDYTFTLLDVRGRLYEMGDNIPDERFEDIVLQHHTARTYRLLRVCKDDECPQPELQHRRHSIHDEKPIHRPTLETRQRQQDCR